MTLIHILVWCNSLSSHFNLTGIACSLLFRVNISCSANCKYSFMLFRRIDVQIQLYGSPHHVSKSLYSLQPCFLLQRPYSSR